MESGWLTMSQAAEYAGPRKGGRPTHKVTVYGWAGVGLRGVVLRTEFRGGVLQTRREWLDEFFAAYDAARRKKRRRERTAAQASRARERARKELEALGAR